MTLGVIGGLGPMATVHFMELITQMTDADRDQDHLDMIVYRHPSIPDRTAYILGESDEDPYPPMLYAGQKLTGAGAECLCIPCMTAHYFYDKLTEALPVPIIHGIRETAAEAAANGVIKVGLMATTGTARSGIFQTEMTKAGIDTILPDEFHQQEVMSVIYDNVKAGLPADMEKFEDAAGSLRRSGAQVLILGCTELSVVKKEEEIGPGYLDALEVLAQRSLLFCGGKLKSAYQDLITK